MRSEDLFVGKRLNSVSATKYNKTASILDLLTHSA